MGDWTNLNREISDWTGGLGIGKVFLKNKEYEVHDPDKDNANKKTAYILDKNSGNFHFLPDLEPEKVVDDLKDYLSAVETVRKELYNQLSLRSYDSISPKTKNCGQINGRFPQAYLDKKSDGIENHFYKRVTVEKYGRFFTANFMRWYVENKTINCIMGGIQFDSTKDKNSAINFEKSISYPNTQGKQELKDLKPNEVKGEKVYFFNPSVSDIWEANGNLVKEFEAFIEKVNELEKT